MQEARAERVQGLTVVEGDRLRLSSDGSFLSSVRTQTYSAKPLDGACSFPGEPTSQGNIGLTGLDCCIAEHLSIQNMIFRYFERLQPEPDQNNKLVCASICHRNQLLDCTLWVLGLRRYSPQSGWKLPTFIDTVNMQQQRMMRAADDDGGYSTDGCKQLLIMLRLLSCMLTRYIVVCIMNVCAADTVLAAKGAHLEMPQHRMHRHFRGSLDCTEASGFGPKAHYSPR